MSGTVGSVSSGGSQSQSDVEYKILCDNAAGINTRFLRRYTYASGAVTTTDTTLDGVTPYTPLGTVIDCADSVEITTECFTVSYTGVDFSAGNRIFRVTVWDTTTVPATIVSTTYYNRNTGIVLATPPALSALYPCDTKLVTHEACYRALTSKPPYYEPGQTVNLIVVREISNPASPTGIYSGFFNSTTAQSWPSTSHAPVIGTDIIQCTGDSDSELLILCDNDAGTITRFLRRFAIDASGAVTTIDTTEDGATPYTPLGTVQFCQPCDRIEVLCDDAGSFLRHFGCDGVVTNTTLDAVTAYTVVGTVKVCNIQNAQPIILCDDSGTFLRHLVYAEDGQSVTIFDTALDGTTAYTATGTVRVCASATSYQLLCDSDSGTVTPFLRRYVTDSAGIVTATDTTIDGITAYTPVGSVGACVPANVDPIILCDDNGSFLRHVVYSDDGATVSMIDTDLEGVVYAPVGDIKNCGASGKALIEACDQTTTTTGNVPGVCGTNQQVVDAVDIQDAEEKNPTTGASAINVNDNDLELAGTAEVGETDWQIAVRFNMGIPQGAQICAAYIQFTSRGTTSVGTLAATISGEAADNSSLFTTAAGMLTARTKTVANVAWNVPSWPTGSQSGADQRTPDLSAIVQEIVDRPGWAAGNATAFFFVPGTTGYRRAQSITSGTAVAPKLHVEYVVDTTGATETICIPFYKEIDLSTGIATGNNYRLNAGIWEAYTPAGTVTDGECICPGTPGDGGTEFEILCLQDANNVRFARVVAIDGATGQYKKVGDYSLDFAGAYTPVGMVAPCSDSTTSLDSEVIALCDNNGSFLRHVVYDANGNVQTVYNTALDGLTAYTPVGTIRACSGSDTEVVQLCDVSAAGVVTPFLRHLTYSSDGTSATIRNTALDGVTAYIPAGTIKTCHVQVPATIDARLREIVAAAAPVTQPIAAIIPAGKRLISLAMSVVAGTATVVDAGNVNTVTNIPTGYSASWSVANDDTLTFPVSITAAANSRILLSFTVR